MNIKPRIPCLRSSAAICISIMIAACAPDPATQVTQVGGRAVEISLHGQGTPTVVFESGLGDDLLPWKEVASRVAARTTCLSYSRAGYGRSAPSGSQRRDQETVAAELDELLRSLGLPPPYILVGHSLGGVFVQAYAASHPADVAALVLVEPTHPNQLARAHRDASRDAAVVDIMSRIAPEPMRAELRAHADMTAFPTPVYTGPVTILAAKRKQALSSDAFHTLRKTLLQEIAANYPQGDLQWVDASHYIHLERPEAVADAIDAILDRSAAPRTATKH